MIYCYELMQWHMQTVAKYFKEEEGKAGDSEEAVDDEKKPTLQNLFGKATARW